VEAIAKLDEIPRRGLVFRYKDGPFDEEGILLRLAGDEIRAYKNQCRHLAMPLDEREPRELWDREGKLLACNSHGARYRPSDGLCVAGPCKGSHLKKLPVEVREGIVWLDTSKLGSFFDV